MIILDLCSASTIIKIYGFLPHRWPCVISGSLCLPLIRVSLLCQLLFRSNLSSILSGVPISCLLIFIYLGVCNKFLTEFDIFMPIKRFDHKILGHPKNIVFGIIFPYSNGIKSVSDICHNLWCSNIASHDVWLNRITPIHFLWKIIMYLLSSSLLIYFPTYFWHAATFGAHLQA